MKKAVVVYCTFSSKEEAEVLAKKAIQQGVSKCVNILNAIDSFYLWQQDVQHEQEYVAIFKATKELKQKIIQFIEENHSYNVPAILCFDVDVTEGFYAFLDE